MKREGFDPVTLELIRNSLDSIADEMAFTVVRTSYSSVVRDAMDFSCSLCDSKGEVISQGVTLPFQLNAVPPALEATFQRYRDSMYPGDVFILNDPFEGGMHLPDIFMFKPVFSERKIVGFAAVTAHHVDVGGRLPGSTACDSTEIFQEGLRIPPLKLYERGSPNETLFRIIEKNVRLADSMMGDLRAKLSACHIGEKGILDLVERYGAETLQEYQDELKKYTERLVRSEISSWPAGSYEFTDYLDDDGVVDEPIVIHVKLTVSGDTVTADFTGSSPQVKGAINCTESITAAAVYTAVRSVMKTDVPNNAGLFRPIRVIAPLGTIANAAFPAASGMRGVAAFRMLDAVFGALSKIIPDTIFAAGDGGTAIMVVGGKDLSGRLYVLYEIMPGSWGARPNKDGIDALSNIASNITCMPVEYVEAGYPLMIDRFGFVPDSEGAGKYRGGLSIVRDWTLLADEATLSTRTDRRKHPPYGLQGGKNGSPSTVILNPDGENKVVGTKVTITFRKGDEVRNVMPGGGGYGDPGLRDVDKVLEDVRHEKVTIERARNVYLAVIDPKTLKIDSEATAKLRSSTKTG